MKYISEQPYLSRDLECITSDKRALVCFCRTKTVFVSEAESSWRNLVRYKPFFITELIIL